MLRKHRLAAVCVASVMLGHTTSAVTPAAFPPGHRFEPSPCPFTPAADQVEGGTLRRISSIKRGRG